MIESPLQTPREEFPLLKEEEIVLEDDKVYQADETYFKGDDNYVENFDYYDEESFDSASLSDSGGAISEGAENSPFKPLVDYYKARAALNDEALPPKRKGKRPSIRVNLTSEFNRHTPPNHHNCNSNKRRISKRVGKGYSTRRGATAATATNRFPNSRAFYRWLKSTENHYRKCCQQLKQEQVHLQQHQEQCKSLSAPTTPPRVASKVRRPRIKTKKATSKKVYYSRYKNRESNMMIKSKKQIREVLKRLNEIKAEHVRMSRGEDVFSSRSSCKQKMFMSVFDQEDLFDEWRRWIFDDLSADVENIFSDWKWNLDEYENAENIFSEWRWNLVEMEQVEDVFNDWRWNLKEQSEVEDIFEDWKKNLVEYDNWNFWREFGTIDDILENTDEILDEIKRMEEGDDWTNWKFWDKFGTVKDIFHNTEATLAEKDESKINADIPDKNDDKNWTKWKFWNRMGPVKSIIYNTEAVEFGEDGQEEDDEPSDIDDDSRDVNNNMEDCSDNENAHNDDNDSDDEGEYLELDSDDDWEAWNFWQEIGSVREILDNNLDIMVFGCFEDFVWLGNDEFLKVG